MAIDVSDWLPHKLPDFTRTSWVSDGARAVWEPRLAAISRAWRSIEVASVTRRVRPAAITSMREAEYTIQAERLRQEGLAVDVLARAASGKGYSTTLRRPRPGEPVSLRVAVGDPYAVSAVVGAYAKSDIRAIGLALGYPACCCDFFQSIWQERRLRDTTWPMAQNTLGATVSGPRRMECTGERFCNPLWRWHGVRAIPHLPCNFQCSESASLGAQLVAVGRDCGFAREMDDLESILEWPAEWSALHGICEIKTPICKVTTNTDATKSKYVARWIGGSPPPESAIGIDFPYLAPTKLRGTKSRSFQRGRDHNYQHLSVSRVNGFASAEAMSQAHAPLAEAAARTLSTAGSVLDLGCGDATLLQRILTIQPLAVPYGLDNDPRQIQAARDRFPAARKHFSQGEISETQAYADIKYCLVLIAVQRLEELSTSTRRNLAVALSACAERTLIYLYKDRSGTGSLVERLTSLGLSGQVEGDDRVRWLQVSADEWTSIR